MAGRRLRLGEGAREGMILCPQPPPSTVTATLGHKDHDPLGHPPIMMGL